MPETQVIQQADSGVEPSISISKLYYDAMRSLFAVRPDDSYLLANARPAIMHLIGSVVEFPWSVAGTNIKNNLIIETGGRSAAGVAKHLIQSGGVGRLYNGISYEATRQTMRQFVKGPGVVVLPPIYREWLPTEWGDNPIQLASGATIGFFDAAVTSPVELLKTRRTTEQGMVAKPLRFSTGFSATLARQTVAWPMLLLSSEFIRKNIEAGTGESITYAQLAATAPIASTGFIVPAHPFDVVKTQQQQVSKSTMYPGIEEKRLFDAMKQVVEKHGIKGLFRGALTSAGQRIPAAFIITASQKFYRYSAKETDEIKPLLGIWRQFCDSMGKEISK